MKKNNTEKSNFLNLPKWTKKQWKIWIDSMERIKKEAREEKEKTDLQTI